MTLWFTGLFAASVHSIYFVPWLGWDLVEPWTYTVSQGTAIGGLIYMYRNRGVGSDFSSLNDFWADRRQRKWQKTYGFDLQKLIFLRQKMERIQEEIDHAELQRFD